MYDLFKESIGSRVEPHIEVEYVFQKIDDIPVDTKFDRVKPWGTGQAILAAARNQTNVLKAAKRCLKRWNVLKNQWVMQKNFTLIWSHHV